MNITARVRDGLCACCGLDPANETGSRGIAEGVWMCGICIRRGHDDPADVRDLLAEIAAES